MTYTARGTRVSAIRITPWESVLRGTGSTAGWPVFGTVRGQAAALLESALPEGDPEWASVYGDGRGDAWVGSIQDRVRQVPFVPASLPIDSRGSICLFPRHNPPGPCTL